MIVTSTNTKEQILMLVSQMTISDEMFGTFNAKIEQKLAAGIPLAKNAELQPLLDRCYSVYLKAVQNHKVNLRMQYELGQNMIHQIQATDDLNEIGPILTTFQLSMVPLQEEHRKLQVVITVLEDMIINMLPIGTTFTR